MQHRGKLSTKHSGSSRVYTASSLTWGSEKLVTLRPLLTHTFSFREGPRAVLRMSVHTDKLIFSSHSFSSFWSCPFSKDKSTVSREMTLLTSRGTALKSSCEWS